MLLPYSLGFAVVVAALLNFVNAVAASLILSLLLLLPSALWLLLLLP